VRDESRAGAAAPPPPAGRGAAPPAAGTAPTRRGADAPPPVDRPHDGPRRNLPLPRPPSPLPGANPEASADPGCRPSGHPRHRAAPRALASPSPPPSPSKGWAFEFKESLLIA